MDGRDGGVPICFVGDEVGPEFVGGEFEGDDDRATRVEGSQEAGHEAVDVEKRHNEHGAIGGGEFIGGLDVLHGASEVAVC